VSTSLNIAKLSNSQPPEIIKKIDSKDQNYPVLVNKLPKPVTSYSFLLLNQAAAGKLDRCIT